jgi:hypothetical protein
MRCGRSKSDVETLLSEAPRFRGSGSSSFHHSTLGFLRTSHKNSKLTRRWNGLVGVSGEAVYGVFLNATLIYLG